MHYTSNPAGGSWSSQTIYEGVFRLYGASDYSLQVLTDACLLSCLGPPAPTVAAIGPAQQASSSLVFSVQFPVALANASFALDFTGSARLFNDSSTGKTFALVTDEGDHKNFIIEV